MLVKEFNFSEDRVKNILDRLMMANKKQAQKGLGEYF